MVQPSPSLKLSSKFISLLSLALLLLNSCAAAIPLANAVGTGGVNLYRRDSTTTAYTGVKGEVTILKFEHNEYCVCKNCTK